MLKPRLEVAVVVLTRHREIWVQERRNTGHLDGFLEFPGGKLQAGEEPVQCACRELKEESGIQLTQGDLRLLQVVDHEYPQRRVRVHFFETVRAPADQPRGGAWFPLDHLDEEAFPPANRAVIDLLRRRTAGQRARPEPPPTGQRR